MLLLQEGHELDRQERHWIPWGYLVMKGRRFGMCLHLSPIHGINVGNTLAYFPDTNQNIGDVPYSVTPFLVRKWLKGRVWILVVVQNCQHRICCLEHNILISKWQVISNSVRYARDLFFDGDDSSTSPFHLRLARCLKYNSMDEQDIMTENDLQLWVRENELE